MSLTASMWTSVSGLLAHGEKMNVIGNNISNVNTVGYKNQRMDFQDFVYQYIGTAAGMGQVGRGTNIGIVMNDFSQGALETTTDSTDIAIQGNGFFAVKPLNNNMTYYTRAGNFRFNKDGYLVDPHGYVLQGWEIDRNAQSSLGTVRTGTGIIGTGSPIDVCLDTFTCPPRHTTKMTVPVNLRYDKVDTVDDKSMDPSDPFFALLKTWDATQDPPIGANKRAYQTTMEVYDEGGRMHKISIYFDRVSGSSDPSDPNYIEGYTPSETYWEYIVTMDPGEDMRDFSSSYDPTGMSPTQPNVPENLKGLLATGTITFSSSGGMKDMSCLVPQTDPAVNSGAWWTVDPVTGGATVDLSKFVAAPLNTEGYPVFAPNFSGTAGLQTAYEQGVYTQPNVNQENRLIALNFGMNSKNHEWAYNSLGGVGSGPGNLVTAADMRINYEVRDTNGNYLYSSGTSTLSVPEGLTTSNVFAAANPPNNATSWTHNFNLGGTVISPATVSFASNSSTQPVLSATAKNPPSDASQLAFTAGAGNFVYERANTAAAYPTSAQIAATDWIDPAAVVGGGYEFVDAAGNKLFVPDGVAAAAGVTPTAAEVKTYLGANAPGALSEVNATQYYWNLTDGSTTVDVTTSDGTSPVAAAAYNGSTDNATKFYWTDTSNPAITATTTTNVNPSGSAWAQMIGTTNSKYHVNGMDGAANVDTAYATTCLGDNYYEHNGMQQDGYTYGDLRYVQVSTDGVLSASYSNGVTLQLYQIVLYDFPSKQNLRREGGNLFTETRESGVPNSGAAGTGTFGTTNGNSLEQSNADLSREFVNMITTQRGFQANSKTITTVDTMLETVISMKR